MAKLTYLEKKSLEEIFEMESGYICDFTNSSFARFIGDIANIDIYSGAGYEEYCSKANKLRQIWEKEPDSIVGEINYNLLKYAEDRLIKNNKLTKYKKQKIDELKTVSLKQKANDNPIILPKVREDSMAILLENINDSLAKNKPELVLDRLHTFATKMLRQICEKNGICTIDNKGNNYPLHSLAGMIKKLYEKDKEYVSSFTVTAIQNSISLFDRYNSIRNDNSFAHDNKILNSTEAEFVVKIIADVLVFIDKVESSRLNSK